MKRAELTAARARGEVLAVRVGRNASFFHRTGEDDAKHACFAECDQQVLVVRTGASSTWSLAGEWLAIYRRAPRSPLVLFTIAYLTAQAPFASSFCRPCAASSTS